MARAWRSANVTAWPCGFKPRLVQDFQENIMFLQLLKLLILGHCFDVVSLGKAVHPQMFHEINEENPTTAYGEKNDTNKILC